MPLLRYVTNFGDPYLTVPLAVLILLWLAMMRSWRATLFWAGGMTLAASAVAASRVAHVVWGAEIEALNFTVVSGHAMLAGAVYPTVFSLCDDRTRRTALIGPYAGGLLLATAIGVSRILLGYHSTAEVVCGLAAGMAVATLTCFQFTFAHTLFGKPGGFTLHDPAWFAAAALAAVVMYHGKVAPVSARIDRDAAGLSQWSKAQLERMRQ
ncbi:phosphatase PAP2 family protein [Burkholderia sp. Ac-20379]|uniref:phosphatase PAP2 family protein n=1 Tax=Burkholderia sp. Ac-20379 TaxID=2703900 RepID=UPI00197E9B7F|nr:phosphatase PAP2 family protein [Burkholderia sp. Ac-20379]MBN3728233.1 phosphatase PAP2 family protein [Burkholderia sp. Ac-20379]